MNRTSAVENSFLAFCTRSQRLGAIWAVQAIASRIDGDCGGWTFLEALQILRLMGARRPLALKGLNCVDCNARPKGRLFHAGLKLLLVLAVL